MATATTRTSLLDVIKDNYDTPDGNVRYRNSYQRCGFCKEYQTNATGLSSEKYNTWFCNGSCQMLYMHDNKHVIYDPAIVSELNRMRKFYKRKDKKSRVKQVDNTSVVAI